MEEISVIEKNGIKDNISNYLNFTVGNDGYGIEVSQIREVIEYSQITNLTHIPMVHESILGVINLRGEVIPVIDLSMRLYDRKLAITPKTGIIIISIEDGGERVTLGAIIDAVKGVVDIYERDIMTAPDFGAKIRSEYIDKIVKIDNEFTVLLNINELLNIDELSDLAAANVNIDQLLSLKTENEDDLDFNTDSCKKEKDYADGDIHNFISLAVDNEIYGIDMAYVNEIISITKMTYVPNALPFMKGVIDLRGKVVPVLDMRERCNLPQKEYTKKTFVLIVKLKDLSIGLIIDSVNNIIKFPIGKIQYPPHYSAKIDSDFIDGLIEKDGEIMILLNVNKILSPEEHDSINKEDFNK